MGAIPDARSGTGGHMAKVIDVVRRLVQGPDYWEKRARLAEDELYRAKVALDAAERHAENVERQRAGWEERARHAERKQAS